MNKRRLLAHRIARSASIWSLLVCLVPCWPVRSEDITTTIPSAELKKIFDGGSPANLADLRAMEQHQRQLSAKVISCTVGIVIGSSHGSGVIISADGYVLTAAHVAGSPKRRANIILPDGRTVPGRSLGLHRTLDAGLVKIDGDGPWPYAELAKAEHVNVGQWCLATGHPGGFEEGRAPVVRIGRVLLTDQSSLTTDCTLIGGDSGGPLFDMQGRVIGINSRIGRFLTANVHVPVAAYVEAWDRLVAGDAWGNLPGRGPYLGVQGEPEAKGAKIAQVLPGSPAEKAGVRTGDVILKFDGKPVHNFAALQTYVGDCQSGAEVSLELIRGEQHKQIKVVIGERER